MNIFSTRKPLAIAVLATAIGMLDNVVWAQSQGAPIPVRDSLIEAIDDIRISAGADGILFLDKSEVEEGRLVNAGQVIAMIDPEQAKLNLVLKQAEEEQARLQAENDINIRAAEKSMEYEWAEAKSAEELHKKQAMPYWDMRREVLEAERSKLAIEMAKNEQQVAEATFAAKTAERQLAEHEIKRRQIAATFNGIIAKRYGKNGEWVQAGTPIVRIVRIDEIKVEGDVKGLDAPERIVIGAPVSIRVHVGGERYEDFESRLEYVSPILESDNTYRVWAKINNKIEGNRYLVSPGMLAEMQILPMSNDGVN
ncbi:multidrug resistance protein MdtN [Rosistilla carotiformis]|uniref:Multidrug resistance protein MdtN n=1 Tax=Rosistilla carotiformis TaxID=2528017 RepID=A0A518JQD2_9BACT|nr:HlyD family efflux transporter periplasmic adaptor subunit [Rosistilla carotiformis]QDV67728.1 multidrug resistance protein MdtN [Rosistilla carotiformis]